MIIKPTICLQTPPTDVSMRCYREGTIDSPEIVNADLWPLNAQGKLIRKRVAIVNRKDDTKLLVMVVSKPDKTWEIHTYPECDDGEMCLIGYDDSGTYNAARYDRIALDSKTFTYEGSDVQLLEEPEYLLHRLIVGIDRTIRKSFCNWLVEVSHQNLNNDYYLTTITPDTGIFLNAKTFIMEIENNWGGSYIGIRRIEFYDLSNNLIPLTQADYTAYATTTYNTSFYPKYAFDTTLSKIGDWTNLSWLGTGISNLRLSCVFNTPKNISKVVITNGHSSGASTANGARNVRILFSTDAITSTVINSTITNAKSLFVGELPIHVSSNIIDSTPVVPQRLNSDISMTSVKSVILDIKNCWGNVSYMGIRSIDFYSPEGQKIQIAAGDITCYATSAYSGYPAANSFITSLSKTGDWTGTQWISGNTLISYQRLICVFAAPKNIGFMVINNGHYLGLATHVTIGAKTTKITFTPDTITSTVYGASISNGVVVFDGDIPAHKTQDAYDNFWIKPTKDVYLINNLKFPSQEQYMCRYRTEDFPMCIIAIQHLPIKH